MRTRPKPREIGCCGASPRSGAASGQVLASPSRCPKILSLLVLLGVGSRPLGVFPLLLCGPMPTSRRGVVRRHHESVWVFVRNLTPGQYIRRSLSTEDSDCRSQTGTPPTTPTPYIPGSIAPGLLCPQQKNQSQIAYFHSLVSRAFSAMQHNRCCICGGIKPGAC